MDKPLSEACLRNQEPISQVLAAWLTEPGNLLEIGSGTGQHAVYCARKLPHVHWQPSELAPYLDGIRAWMAEAQLDNVAEPLALDVRDESWPTTGPFDAVFTANTLHFVGWNTVRALFQGVARVLKPQGLFLAYSAYNENHQYTSEGNRLLDVWLKSRDPDSGIKDVMDVADCAAEYGLTFLEQVLMPANNRILIFRREGEA